MANPVSQFISSGNRWDMFEDPCGMMNASLSDVSSRVAANESSSLDDRIAKLERLKKCAKDLSVLEAEAKARSAACKEIAQQLQGEVNGQPIDDFDGLCEEGFSAAEQTRVDASRRKPQSVKDLDALIDRVSGRVDEDDVEVAIGSSSRQNLKCPILQRPIEHPVKNKLCGHVYSLEGSIQFLYQKMQATRSRLPKTLEEVPPHFQAPCPAAQCTRILNKSVLRRDYQAELTQRQQSAIERRASQSGVDDAVDVL